MKIKWFYAKFDFEFKVISIYKYLVIQNGDLINLIIKKLNKLPRIEACFSFILNVINLDIYSIKLDTDLSLSLFWYYCGNLHPSKKIVIYSSVYFQYMQSGYLKNSFYSH